MENYKESLEYKFAEAWVQPESEDNVRALEKTIKSLLSISLLKLGFSRKVKIM